MANSEIKIVMNRSVKEQTAVTIKHVEKFYRLVEDILCKWELCKSRKYAYLKLLHVHINVWSRNLDVEQSRY
jgi:hypothetical protein